MKTKVQSVFQGVCKSPGLTIFALIILGSLIRLPQIGEHLGAPYLFRRSQTALVTREISERGFFESGLGPMPVFGPNSQIPFEFPLFQQLAAVLVNLGVPLEVSGRALGLFFFQASAFLIYLLVRRKVGNREALLSVIIIQTSPFGFIWATAFLIEFMATFFGLAMLAFAWKSFEEPGKSKILWLLASSLMGVVVSVVKVTTSGVFLILLVSLAIAFRREFSQTRFVVIGLAFICAVAVASGAVWTSVADSIKSSQESTRWLTSSALRNWNFGTLEQRFSPNELGQLMSHLVPVTFGGGLLVIAMAFVVSRRKIPKFVIAMAVSAAAGPLIFFNLYVVHSYYFAAIFFQICVILGWSTSVFISHVFRKSRWVAATSITFICSTCAVVLFGVSPIKDEILLLYSPRAESQVAADLSSIAGEQDVIFLTNCDWDPQVAYETGFAVFMLREQTEDVFEAEKLVEVNKLRSGTLLGSCRPIFGTNLPNDSKLKHLSPYVVRVRGFY